MRIFCTQERHETGGPGRFILARAEEALPELVSEYEGKVQLVYLDPPFGTGDTFHVRLGGRRASSVPAFTDRMNEKDYLAWMRTVLTGAKRLLGPEGSIYLHIDYRMSAKLRLLMDDIFGEENFLNEIVWCYKSGGRSTRYYPRKHDTILFYRKSSACYFNIQSVGKPRGPEKRNHMKRYVDEQGRVCFTIRSAGKVYSYYEDALVYPSDVWDDIEHLQQKDKERTGYATQKPEALLSRVILASSRTGDLVCDLFSGSGTTAAAAAKLGRRYLALDASPFSLYILRARQLQSASSPSLLEIPREMRLFYPAGETKAEFSARVARVHGRNCVILESASFDGGQPLVYAALGTERGGVFTPCATAFNPVLPLSFPLEEGMERPVLQFADALGRQAFFTVGD